MKKNIVLCLVIASVFCILGVSYAMGTNKTVKKEIQSLFNQVAAAFDAKDVEGIVESAAPDAILNYKDGKIMTIREWKDVAAVDFVNTETMRSKFKVGSIEVIGDIAIVDYTEIHDYVLVDDKSALYHSVSRWQATLVRMPKGEWRINVFTELSEKITRNGKSVDISKESVRW